MTLVGNFMAGMLGTFGILAVKSVSDILWSYVSPSGNTLEQSLGGVVSGGNGNGNGGRA